jgi:hypothetical protein
MVLASPETVSKNASGGPKESDEKYHKKQTTFSPESNLGSSSYEERLSNNELRRPVFIYVWYEQTAY